MFRKKITRKSNLIIIYLNDSWGFDEISGVSFLKLIESYSPDYYEYLNPNSFYIYYFNNELNQKKAHKLIEEAKIESKKYIDSFEKFRIGIAEGEMVCSLNSKNNIIKPPIGEAGNLPLKNIIYSLS